MPRFLRRVRDAFRAHRLDRDLREQIASHLEEATEDFVREGLSLEEARRAARRRFGDVGRVEEAWRETRSFFSLDYVRRDVRHALRALGRNPAFSLTIVSVLSIGIAAMTSVFTLLNGVVLRPLPYPESERLVVIRHAAPGLGLADAGLSNALYWMYAGRSRSLESLAAYLEPVSMNLRLPEAGTERITVTHASARLFDVLRAAPAHGRLFTEEDGQPGFMNMRWRIPVLLSHDFWMSHFGGDADAIGRTITLNENAREIVGVLPASFAFPDGSTQVWMLIEPTKMSDSPVRNLRWSAAGRMHPRATAASVRNELADLVAALSAEDEDVAEARLAPIVISMKSAVIADVAALIWLLFGGMVFLLLVACANAGLLFLVRVDHRVHEMAVRRSLGAHGPHLARLFFIEALALTGTAAAAGLLAANAFTAAASALIPFALPRTSEIRLDTAVASLAILLAIAMAAFYGGIAMRRQRHWPGLILRAGPTAAGTSRRSASSTNLLLVVQVSLAVCLMVGAILMVKTARNLLDRTPGFSSDGVLTLEMGLPGRRASQHARIYQEVVDRLRQLPGVEAAAAASFVPLTSAPHLFPVTAGGEPIPFKFFVPGYFQTMRTPVVEGAAFAQDERVPGSHPVLVSATLARRLFAGGRAVGRTLRRFDAFGNVVELGRVPVAPFTIAGIVSDVHEVSLRGGPAEVVYVPVIDPPVEQAIVPTTMRLVVRSRGSVQPLAADVRQIVAAVDPSLSVGRVETMDAIVAGARAREVFLARLLTTAAALSLFLGAVGIYGTVRQAVRRRTREIGIRIALGASRADVVRLVTNGVLRVVLLGVGIGIVVAAIGADGLRLVLFGVEAHDPLVFVIASVVLIVSAAAAALLAARRGAAVAPLLALRGPD